MNPAHPGVFSVLRADLDALAESLHRTFLATTFEVRVDEQRAATLHLGWEIFDDPHEAGKILVVRFLDHAAADGARLAGKLTAALRPRPGGGVLLDGTHPFHGISLRPAFQRRGLVSTFVRRALLDRLPARSAVAAPVGTGTAAGVALAYFRGYMQQRRGADWLDSDEGQIWWQSLPEHDDLDWDSVGGFPAVFALLRACGLSLRLDGPSTLMAEPDPGRAPRRASACSLLTGRDPAEPRRPPRHTLPL